MLGGSTTPVLEGSRYYPCSQADPWVWRKQALETNITYSTPVLSKLAEDFVVDLYVKPAALAKVDPRQFGIVPGLGTSEALVSMIHVWNSATDGNEATMRVVLFDFKKAFDLIDHRKVEKLWLYDIPDPVISWIIDFLTSCKQRVKLGHNCFSESGVASAWVPQGAKLGLWLFIIMINGLDVPATDLWKYVDDTTISENKQEPRQSHPGRRWQPGQPRFGG